MIYFALVSIDSKFQALIFVDGQMICKASVTMVSSDGRNKQSVCNNISGCTQLSTSIHTRQEKKSRTDSEK